MTTTAQPEALPSGGVHLVAEKRFLSLQNLTHGVSELKVDAGPGYRVYYSQRGDRLLLLLAGGDKSTQAKDIARAIRLAQAYGD
jgi:putative addiction module killer protein